MKKNLLLLLCLFCLVNVCHAKAKDTFTVFQLNLWHGCTKVPNGDQGIIDVLDQMDADVVFLCEIRDGKQFIPHVIEELEKTGARVVYFDPWVRQYKYKGQIRKSEPELDRELIEKADLVMVTAAHTNVDYEMVQRYARAVFDTKNVMKDLKNRENIEVL